MALNFTDINYARCAFDSQMTGKNTVDSVNKKLAFEIFHLFSHHWKVQLNVVLMAADNSKKVKFELIQHLKHQIKITN